MGHYLVLVQSQMFRNNARRVNTLKPAVPHLIFGARFSSYTRYCKESPRAEAMISDTALSLGVLLFDCLSIFILSRTRVFVNDTLVEQLF